MNVITCAECGLDYKGETGDVQRKRVTVHKQQIRDPHKKWWEFNTEHIDKCSAGLTPFFFFSFSH